MEIRKELNCMNIIVAILILGVIIIIHELGHFLLAKKNGITVVEFSVGMGPRIASFVRNGTRYSLKVLPIGGSCMMLGEDEAVDDEGAFGKKGVWARFSVIFAGAFFNFVLAFLLALILIGESGVDKPYVTVVEEGSPAAGLLEEGDLITKINDSSIHFSQDIYTYFYFSPVSEKPVEVTLKRDGEKKTVLIQPKVIEKYLLGCNYNGQGETSSQEARLEYIAAGYPMAEAGMSVGDIITNINGTKIGTGAEMSAYLQANPLSSKEVNITYLRNDESKTVTLTPRLNRNGYMGWDYNPYREKVSALSTISYSFYEVKNSIVNTVKGLGQLISGKASMGEISGPVGIVNIVGDIVNESEEYGIRVTLLSLIQFSILISANLGVMNLLPLPALDGGRLVFLLIEAIRRKPVPKEKEAMVHAVGMALLMILMVFVLFNDVRNIFK